MLVVHLSILKWNYVNRFRSSISSPSVGLIAFETYALLIFTNSRVYHHIYIRPYYISLHNILWRPYLRKLLFARTNLYIYISMFRVLFCYFWPWTWYNNDMRYNLYMFFFAYYYAWRNDIGETSTRYRNDAGSRTLPRSVISGEERKKNTLWHALTNII